jgi:hypothetical protein
MAKHLVLFAGGHAHMVTLANINAFVGKNHRVTVIGPSEHHFTCIVKPIKNQKGKYSKMDLPLLKNDIKMILRHQKSV